MKSTFRMISNKYTFTNSHKLHIIILPIMPIIRKAVSQLKKICIWWKKKASVIHNNNNNRNVSTSTITKFPSINKSMYRLLRCWYDNHEYYSRRSTSASTSTCGSVGAVINFDSNTDCFKLYYWLTAGWHVFESKENVMWLRTPYVRPIHVCAQFFFFLIIIIIIAYIILRIN